MLIKTGQTYRGIQYPAGPDLVVQQPQMVVFGHEYIQLFGLKRPISCKKITKNF